MTLLENYSSLLGLFKELFRLVGFFLADRLRVPGFLKELVILVGFFCSDYGDLIPGILEVLGEVRPGNFEALPEF